LSEAEVKLLSEINKKLETLIMLSAATVAGNEEVSQSAKVDILSNAGLTSEEIGKFIGMRAESVRRIRSKARNT